MVKILIPAMFILGAATVKEPKKEDRADRLPLVCHPENKEVRLAQMRLDLAIEKFHQCIENLVNPMGDQNLKYP